MFFKKSFWFRVFSRWGSAMVLGLLILGSLVPAYEILGADDPVPPPGGTPGASTTLELPNPLECDDVFCVILRIIRGLRWVAIPVSTVMVVVGGYQIMAAGGDPEKFSNGRKTIIYAAVGLAVIILAEAVFYIVSDAIGGSGAGVAPPPGGDAVLPGGEGQQCVNASDCSCPFGTTPQCLTGQCFCG